MVLMLYDPFNGPYRYTEAIDLFKFDRDEVLVEMLGGVKIAMNMRCPCGCSTPIRMKLAGEPQRSISRTKDGYVDYNPSINRTAEGGCKSHFFIRNGMIEWC